ncbi:MAG: APC family permease [Actinobacteria bacterium]|nr:APC family permease [Actinomycetota bacterium]
MVTSVLKRVMVGSPLSNDRAAHSLLPKWLALPVFCSDPLSSVAYATEQILLVLVLGGVAALTMTPWVGLAVVGLLIIVVASYRKTVYAYPGGGGAYAVAKDNFGQKAALVAASALVVDYILTVAVSIASGVANLASAFPGLGPWVVEISLAMVVLLTVVNLRGVKESGLSFALPTYAFIASVLIMLGMALWKGITGDPVVAESAGYSVDAVDATAAAAVFLLLRAFASGCTALTGVEAVSNGVPFFRKPKSRNAAVTLTAMGALAVVMFGGITALAVTSGVKIAEDPATLGLPADTVQPTVIAQLGTAVFGAGSIGFFALQLFTTAVLVLAANTAYNSFPILGSVLGRDGFLPRQFGRRGDRLVFSNGVLILAGSAAVLLVAFDASVTRLVQLYILGVFLSFTISQGGMVRHWGRELRTATGSTRGRIQRSRALNMVGACVTALVLVIVVFTKFSHGAWLVIIAVPVFYLIMTAIQHHYQRTDRRLAAPPGGFTLPSRVHSVVLVSRLNAPAMQALAFARAARPSSLVGLHVQTDRSNVRDLEKAWEQREIPVPLVVVDSPFRDVTGPVVDYVKRMKADRPGDMVAVYIPEYVVRHWWEGLLHNQSAIRLKTRLLFVPGVVTTSVPMLLAGVQEPRQPDQWMPPREEASQSGTHGLA